MFVLVPVLINIQCTLETMNLQQD